VTTASLARSPEARGSRVGRLQPPPGPSRLASLSSGDGRSQRQGCTSALPTALCYSATLRRWRVLSAPLGAAWPACLDPIQHSDGPHAIAPRRPGTHEAHSHPDDGATRPCTGVGLARTLRGDWATPTGVDASPRRVLLGAVGPGERPGRCSTPFGGRGVRLVQVRRRVAARFGRSVGSCWLSS
jgi:hypothetical protein